VSPAPKPPPNGDGEEPNVHELEKELAVTRERLEGVARERDQLDATNSDLQQKLAETTDGLQAAEKELGRLGEVSRQRDELVGANDQLRQQLADLQTGVDQRVESAVRSALEQSDSQHKATVAQLNEEIDSLQTRVAELEGQVRDEGVTSRVTPTALAGHFAGMLDQLGTTAPTEGKQVTAALTNLEVEAKGVLEAPREGEDEPVLRTVEGGDVHPEALSTVRMSFRLLPHVLEPPPEE
jgi:predicted nuclease with TOPRIM domain